jgi:hypothetical protein
VRLSKRGVCELPAGHGGQNGHLIAV